MIEQINVGEIKWYHCLHANDEDLEFIQEKFHFHPLDIEDCKGRSQRSKIDIYDDYYFLILHFPYFDKINRFVKTKEAKIFWGKNYIITIGNSHWVIKDLFNKTKEAVENNEIDDMMRSSDTILYTILETLMKETLVLLHRVDFEIDAISKEMFNRKADKVIEKISITRKNVIYLNTTFKPQLRLFHKFESGDVKGFVEGMEDYWGNILDYYQKIWDLIEDDGEIIEGLSKTFDSQQANRTNEIMKVLTFISTIILPLTFITGLYGMNVSLPLEKETNAFYLVLVLMAFITIILLLFFRRKKWL